MTAMENDDQKALHIGKAAQDIASLLFKFYMTEQGLHAETIIGAAAALTGEWSLRATEQPLPENGFVVGDEINRILFGDDVQEDGSNVGGVWAIVANCAIQSGLSEDQLPNPIISVAQVAAAMGGSSFPPLTIPREHYPHEWSPVAGPRFRNALKEIFEKNGLDAGSAAASCALATSLLLNQTNEVLKPETSVKLVLEIMVGVSRMAPVAKVEEGMSPYGEANE